MIRFRQKGDFSKLTKWMGRIENALPTGLLDKYGRAGVAALQAETPRDTGETASSWYYQIEHRKGSSKLIFCNSHIHDGVLIAIILQYGHATGNGGWVEGVDYINPALSDIFRNLADEAWREVKKL